MGRWRTSGDGWECRPDGHWIESERLTLRPLTKSDFEPMLAVFDDEVVRWQGYASDPAELRKYVRDWIDHVGQPNPKGQVEHWAVCDRQTGEMVGNRHLFAYGKQIPARGCETGGSFKGGWREKGYGTEELTALLKLISEHLGYSTVLAATTLDNERALRLYQGRGFRRYVAKPGWKLPNGTTTDVVVLRLEQDAHCSCKKAARRRFF